MLPRWQLAVGFYGKSVRQQQAALQKLLILICHVTKGALKKNQGRVDPGLPDGIFSNQKWQLG
jgi:hypothetical protein